MDNRTLIIALTVLGVTLLGAFVAIVLFYGGDKALAIAGLVTVAGLIVPQMLSLKASSDNATKLERVDRKIDGNTATTELTHTMVNSRMDQLIETVKRLAEAQQQLSSAQSLAQGISIGRAQVSPDAPLDPTGGADEPKPVA